MKYSAKKKQEKTKTKQGKNDKLNKQGKKNTCPLPPPTPITFTTKLDGKAIGKKSQKTRAGNI